MNNQEILMPKDSLQLGQIIYTSFDYSGFTLVKSSIVPAIVQEFYTAEIIQKHWDAYNPPKIGYRAAYLYQIPKAFPGTLFGWLYHDGQDELSRAGVPYFLAYYLPGSLVAPQLSRVLACLHKGPIDWIDRFDSPPQAISELTLVSHQEYNGTRPGIELPAELRVESFSLIQARKALNWFYSAPDLLIQTSPNPIQNHQSISRPLESESSASPSRSLGATEMPETALDPILRQLVSKSIGIQGATLVSAEGQMLLVPIGLDENQASILAGNMLWLFRNTQEELDWQKTDSISIRGSEGFLILKYCSPDIYLLVKSDKVPIGLIEGEVSRAVEKLVSVLEKPTLNNTPTSTFPESKITTAEFHNPVEESLMSLPIETNHTARPVSDAVIYRGRQANL